MINNEIKTTKGMESAQKALEYAMMNRVVTVEVIANLEMKEFEKDHKYMMGGCVVVKYFPKPTYNAYK